MHIYIDPFWGGYCLGVFSTVGLFFGVIIYYGCKNRKHKRG